MTKIKKYSNIFVDDIKKQAVSPHLRNTQNSDLKGVTVYAPVPKPKDKKRDRYQPLEKDSKPVADWRKRMGTDKAKEIYKDRAATAECVNAIAHNRGLCQFAVRGLNKVKTSTLWFVLAHNVMREASLRQLVA